MAIDDKDRLLLAELQRDSRQGLKELSKKLDMPMSTVHERVKRREADGTILKYTAVINPEKVDAPITAFILLEMFTVSPTDGKPCFAKTVATEVAKLPGVQEAHVITGDKDVLVKVRGQSIREIGNMVLDKLIRVRGVKKTITLEVLATAKDTCEIDL